MPGQRGTVGRLYALGDRPAVHLRRAVIDAERADIAENLLYRRIIGDTRPAHDLHRPVGNPE